MVGSDSPLDLLRRLTGDTNAAFHDGQREAVDALVERARRVLCVQRTGWGKSAVYFIATAVLREQGVGPTILVSPLIALMRNQVAQAERLGIRARTINSSNRDDWPGIFAEIDRDEVDVVLISPERLANDKFRSAQLPGLLRRPGILVIDEAHCISDWGHDFRPDYRRIARVVKELPADTSVLCTTATANDRVVDDVVQQLGGDAELLTIRGTLDRPSLRLEVVELASQAERLAWLATHLPAIEGNGIVYCLTVRDTQVVAAWLSEHGISALDYSGPVESDRRIEIEQALLQNKVKAVAATSALGMGYDKPDLGFVIHFQAPGSPITYYQQVGRAGRALDTADAVLLRGAEDREIQDYFIKQAFPPPDQIDAVLDRLASSKTPVPTNGLLREVNIGVSRLAVMLKSLDVDGVIRKAAGGWQRTEVPHEYDPDHVRSIIDVRRREQEAMERYGRDGRCLMEALRSELDDPEAERCGRCAECTEPRFSEPLDRTLVIQAVRHLRGQEIVLEPRKRLPIDKGQGRTIPPDELLEPGRALSIYGDAGWGYLVRSGKFEDDRFSDDLVEACVALLLEWSPEPAPEWITAVPSLRQAGLVPDFAARLATALGIDFVPAVRKLRATQEQQQMANSVQQLANVEEAFAVDDKLVRSEPVLLVNDIVDSRWTMTEVGRKLGRAGVEVVYPMALASSATRTG